jgi:hypothetical protein
MKKIVIVAYFPNAKNVAPETVFLAPEQAAAIPLIGDRFVVNTNDGPQHWKVTARSFGYSANEINVRLTCEG